MKIALVYGTSSPARRLATALAAFAERLKDHDGVAVAIVDLAKTPLPDPSGASLNGLSETARSAIHTVSSADAVIVFSPVYRASMPGSLKNLFDLLPIEALEAKPVGAVAMGASPHHFLAIDLDLHPILSWFGAISVPGLYLTSRSFVSGELTSETVAMLTAYAGSVLDIAERLRGLSIAPRPLAAQ